MDDDLYRKDMAAMVPLAFFFDRSRWPARITSYPIPQPLVSRNGVTFPFTSRRHNCHHKTSFLLQGDEERGATHKWQPYRER